ncbi:hypothetical protein Goshw_012589 [Gossypium schwendimanii]|uniref:Uncharacterized protein n=1 Tax=Gossypium schwendimanii TaxID=34291 RepID=A0A7J9M3C4_GOSSC|nr:hypothetical protein [Gossypium schwendimanii]
MAISDDSTGAETSFLKEDGIDGCVDYKGCLVERTNCGGLKSASFIIEIGERFAYSGINSNLVTCLQWFEKRKFPNGPKLLSE